MLSMSDEEIVARFVDQLHEEFDNTLSEQNAQEKTNRRHAREKCESKRMIAPWDGESAVSLSDFHPVLCRDISIKGLSFWANEKPNTGYFIVQLEANAELAYLKFRVTRTTPEFARGRPAFVVGCEYIGRLDRIGEG